MAYNRNFSTRHNGAFQKEGVSLKSMYTVTLYSVDIFQTIDALSSRAEAYEQTARYLMGNHEEDEHIIIEECSDQCEAEAIANHFREIINIIEDQINSSHQ